MNKIVDDLDSKMNIRTWPHQFTRSGRTEVIGENRDFMPDGEHPMKVLSYEMYCVHCKHSYWTIKAGPPPPPCPARNKNREMKRILS